MATVPWRMRGSESRLVPPLLPARPLLSLGLLQLVLGCSMVALSFGALSLSNSPPVRNSCPFWAGSSVSAFQACLFDCRYSGLLFFYLSVV